MDAKQFKYDAITCLCEDHTEGDEDCCEWDHPYFFTCAMVASCGPLFHEDWDNYDVEQELKRNEVIQPCGGDEADSESCQLFVNFTTRSKGELFIDRLNAFLKRKAKALQGRDFARPQVY